MTLINVTLDVAEDLWEKIQSGELMLLGGTVRDKTGAIVKLLDDGVPEQVKDLAAKGAGFISLKRLGIGAGLVGAAVVGAVAYKAISGRRQAADAQPPGFVTRFTVSLSAYLDAARTGNLGADDVGRLIADLDEVKAQNNSGEITFPAALWDTLLDLVAGYTQKLAEVNHVETVSGRQVERRTDRDVLSELRDQLELQQRILKDAA